MSIGKFMQQASQRDYSVEWQAPGTFPWIFQRQKEPLEPKPYSVRENYIRCVKGEKPYWMPAYFYDANIVWPDAMEEHPVPEVDGYDWWGVNWVMVDSAGGMITKPGTRVISDFANWKEDVEWPDVSQVDFETDGVKLQKMMDPDRVHIYECVEGIFERLHEMMPFDETLVAFYEEPELLDEFFEKMADYKIETTEKVFQYYGRVDGVLYHDDWGTERSGFFSNEMFRQQLMPSTSRWLKFVKDQGKFIELHSCGRNMQYVPEMIEMGIDMWTPQMRANDADYLYENFGDRMSFCFGVEIDPKADEAEVRKIMRDFVDHYGAKGRCMPWIMTDMSNPNQDIWARDELFNYSYEYYNKLYDR